MDSPSTQIGRNQMAPKECGAIIPVNKYPSSRRTPSISSSASLSSSSSSSSLGSSLYFLDNSPLSPATPLRFLGVPFSWEHLPGSPKKLQNQKKNKESIKFLPLPPSTSKKYNFEEVLSRKKASAAAAAKSFRKDPFFVAMVECSKDDDDDDQESASNFWSGAKVTRSISDKFEFINLYNSCKRTCAVSESIVNLPRSSRPNNYGLIDRRSR